MTQRFAADRMLGRLARTLRLLGYDTLYSPQMTTAELREIARRGERVVLTRGHASKRFPGLTNIYSVGGEHAPEQLSEVVRHFQLDTHTGLWTRCTLCNASIEKVEKELAEPHVEPKVLRLYDEFSRCTGCGHIYWHGSHVERTIRNLASILGEPGRP